MRYFFRFFITMFACGLLVIGCKHQVITPPAGAEFSSPTTKPATPVYPDRLRGAEPVIRVRCLVSNTEITLLVSEPYSLNVITLNSEAIAGQGDKQVAIGVEPMGGGVKIGKDIYQAVTVTPRGAAPLKIRYTENGKIVEREFPGAFSFKPDKQGRVQLIATLPLEDYLIGVIAGEMPLSWMPEALKAQTVCSRTYALYEIKRRANSDYDVERDTRSQVWNPRNTDIRARLAVQATRGEILTENMQLFPAYFHSQCGGVTADGRKIFFGTTANALRGGVKCFNQSPREWEKVYGREEISAKLAAKKLSGGKLLRIELLDENQQPVGSTPTRAYFARLFNENGVERVVPFNDFRLAVGAERGQIESSFLLVTHIEQHLKFSGRGAGHGVGLCQYGAAAAAERHINYRQIVQHYYPGAAVVKVW